MGRPTAFDHADVPTSVFSQPPVGAVGLTEAQARHRWTARSTSTARCSSPMRNVLGGNPTSAC